MTCRDILSQLDRLIDDELSPDQAATMHRHFNECTACREEYELAQRMVMALETMTTPVPNSDYWSEVNGLVLARTVDGEIAADSKYPFANQKGLQRKALVRSILSVAASMVILFSALLIGSQHQTQMSTVNTATSPVLATADVRELLASDNTAIFSREHQIRLAQGMLLVGLPGSLGRFAGLPELFNTVE
ncbi:MAG: zf-HC2 domain-containing protein [candidate division Zixibacteria bacterium]|nr:zf-HC2 domain-containing protein [candidate division Zixibacteria bacterium]